MAPELLLPETNTQLDTVSDSFVPEGPVQDTNSVGPMWGRTERLEERRLGRANIPLSIARHVPDLSLFDHFYVGGDKSSGSVRVRGRQVQNALPCSVIISTDKMEHVAGGKFVCESLRCAKQVSFSIVCDNAHYSFARWKEDDIIFGGQY